MLLKFELKKILKEKVLYILLASFLVLILVPSLMNNSFTSDELALHKSNLEMSESALDSLKTDPTAEQTVADIIESNTYLSELIMALEKKDEKAALKAELKYENKNLEDMKAGTLVSIPEIEQEKIVKTLDYLDKNNYSKVDDNSEENGLPAVNYLLRLFSSNSISILIFAFINLILGYLFSMDKRRKNIDLVNSTPESLWKLASIKYLSITSFIILSVYTSFLIVFLINAVRFGVGNFNYPVAIINSESMAEIMTASSFLNQLFVFILLWIIFFSILSFCLSLYTGNMLANIFILFIIVISSQFSLLEETVPKGLAHFFVPFYINFPNLLLGGSGYEPLFSNELTFANGTVVLTSYIGILLLITGTSIGVKREL